MTLPRDYARCLGSPDNPLCQGCARYTKNNQDPEDSRVSFIAVEPLKIHKMSGHTWDCGYKMPLENREQP